MKNPIPESALPNHIGFLGITVVGRRLVNRQGAGVVTANPELF